MGLGLATAAIGAIGARRNKRDLNKLLDNAPQYQINDEAYDNQAIAKSQAFGRDRSIQKQQTQLDQDAANSANQALNVTDSTSGLLSTIAAINASKNNADRGLAQQEAGMQNQKIQQLYGVNNAMIDEKDKAWNYNKNMPYQMRVASLRDRRKFNEELLMKGIDTQAAQDNQAISTFGNMFSMGGGK